MDADDSIKDNLREKGLPSKEVGDFEEYRPHIKVGEDTVEEYRFLERCTNDCTFR